MARNKILDELHAARAKLLERTRVAILSAITARRMSV